MVVICAGCERPILERFLLNVLDRAWHAKCVQCTDCKGPLTDKCFSRGGKLYCREDFFRRFGTKCGGCSQGISPNDLVRRARNKVFHLKCFTCMLCRKQLSTGEELYVLDENKFICKEDYLNSKYAGSDGEDNDLDFDQAMLDKVDDTLSDKASSLQDDDSRDSSLPLGGVQHHNGHMTSQHVPLAHAPSLPGTLSPGGAAAAAAAAAAASGAGVLMPEIKQEKNNNMETGGAGDTLIATSGQNGGPHDLNSNHSDTDSSHSNSDNSNNSNNNNKENNNNKDSCNKDEKVDEKQSGGGTKRRGPRTTIKAKQLETLKAAFAATPKPTRHIREQLAQETGLNMRVIQVWFQNRRSKERRMKQLSALGARRQFFRNPRRLRALRPGEELDGDMMQAGFNYFGENGDFYPGFPGYGDYYPGQPGEHVPGMTFLPPSQGNPPMVEPLPGQMPPGGEGQFGALGDLSLPPSGSPEPHIPIHPDGTVFGNGGHPPRSMAGQYNQGIQHGPSQEMTSEAW